VGALALGAAGIYGFVGVTQLYLTDAFRIIDLGTVLLAAVPVAGLVLVGTGMRRQLAAEPGDSSLANVDSPSLVVQRSRDILSEHLGAENAIGAPDHLVGDIVRRVEESADVWSSRAAVFEDVQYRRELGRSPHPSG